MLVVSDLLLIDLMVPVRCILASPAIGMEFDDKVLIDSRWQNALLNLVETGRFVGWCEKNGWLRWVKIPPALYLRPVKFALKDGIEFGIANNKNLR